MRSGHPVRVLLALVMLSLPLRAAVLDSFEQATAPLWTGGLLAVAPDHAGQALAWDTLQPPRLVRTLTAPDWTGFETLTLDLWSDRQLVDRIEVRLTDAAGENGYRLPLHISWTGWQFCEWPLAAFEPVGHAPGFDHLARLELVRRVVTDEPTGPPARLYLDNLILEPASATLRLRRSGLDQLRDGRLLLNEFSRGGAMDGWSAELSEYVWQADAVWGGARIALKPGESLTLTRTLDQALDGWYVLALGATSEPAVKMTVAAMVDGAIRGPDEVSPADPVTRIVVAGKRLEAVTITISAPSSAVDVEPKPAALLQYLALQPRERITLRARQFSNRGVLLDWSRPAWGGSRYLVAREQQRIADPAAALAIAAGWPAQTPWLIDVPPTDGDWFYAAAPLEETGPGLTSQVAVAAKGGPPPLLCHAEHAVVVDGELAEWPKETGAIVLASANSPSFGDALSGPDDLGGRIQMAYDDGFLYLAADVTDDHVAHRNSQVWQGDSLALMLGMLRPGDEAGVPPYDVAFCWPAVADGQAKVLQDAVRVFPPDSKPDAPGLWTALATPNGYRLEAAVPLADLLRFGVDLKQAGWLAVGLSLYDADQPTGETRRQSVLSWNQSRGLYDPAEASLVKVQRWP